MSNVIPLHENSVRNDTPSAWEIDCGFGRDKAQSLIAEIAHTADYPAGLAEIRQLVGAAQLSGVEIGFFQRLLELAVSSAQDARTLYPAPDQ